MNQSLGYPIERAVIDKVTVRRAGEETQFISYTVKYLKDCLLRRGARPRTRGNRRLKLDL